MVVQGGLDAFNALRGGFPTSESLGRLNQMYQDSMGYLNQAQQTFAENARRAYRMISESESANLIRNLGTKLSNIWSNGIEPLESLEDCQTASEIMQRWIMAQPHLRQLYLDNRVEGYSDQYENLQGNRVGEEQYDYRRVMTGVQVTPDEGDAYYKLYHDTMPEGESVLSVTEQINVLSTWSLIDRLIDEGDEDPTSPYGASIG